MKYFSWNNDKNAKLKRERDVSFEEVIFHIQQGQLLAIVAHPNPEKYPGQKMLSPPKEVQLFVIN